jgi:CDP-paratose 2-epimerase
MKKKKILVTGGAGFIGVNTARYFLQLGHEVAILDNLSRRGAEANLEWLKGSFKFDFHKIDVRDALKMQAFFKKHSFDVVIHCAGQVAVTTSVLDPRTDFEINAGGTFNLLEGVRLYNKDALVLYASTNKVYGEMLDLNIVERNNRYQYQDYAAGIDEKRNLDFHSPYGCSKGCADQYMIDYARIYNLRVAVFRQSCIYGQRQFGIEDQGWVAWFCIAAVLKKPITIYGDGKQVRDILHVDDLIRLYALAIERQDQVSAKAFNVGGGPANTMSLLELISFLEKQLQVKLHYTFDHWRPGDQKVYVSNIAKAAQEIGWQPQIKVAEGISRLISWVYDNQKLFKR